MKFYIKLSVDVFFTFIRVNVLQDVLTEICLIDKFYFELFQHLYLNEKFYVRNIQTISYRFLNYDEKKILIYNAVNNAKIHLMLVINYYVVLKHENIFDNENQQIISNEMANIKSFLLFFKQNFTSEERRNFQQDFRNIDIIYEAIYMMNLIINFLKKLYILKEGEKRVFVGEILFLNQKLFDRFKDFYKIVSLHKIEFGFWIFSFLIHFFFEILINHIEKYAIFYLPEEFFNFCAELCKMHFESFSVSKI